MARDDLDLLIGRRKPTLRDRWRHFHRLWRIANGHGGGQDIAVAEALRVIGYGRWARLLDSDASDGYVDRSRIPTFLRKDMLRIRRKQRLYAGHYEWQERDKVTANRCRDEHGIEVTPLEVAEVRRKVIQMARAKAAEMDFPVPDDDEELLRLLKPQK